MTPTLITFSGLWKEAEKELLVASFGPFGIEASTPRPIAARRAFLTHVKERYSDHEAG